MAKYKYTSVGAFADWLENNDIGIEKIYLHTHGQPPLEVSAMFYNMALDTVRDKIELRGIDAVFNISCIRQININVDKKYKGVAVGIECESSAGTYSFELKLL